MATHIAQWLAKASFTTADLTGGTDGGMLSNGQARVFLKDAIEATVILQRSDVFDSEAPKFEVPKINMASRIMRGGTEGARLGDSDRVKASTGLVTLSTELFKGEVPVSDETFEDNVEQDGLADSLMTMIAEAVGRDLEEIAIKSSIADTDLTFGLLDGVIEELRLSSSANKVNVSTATSYKAMFKTMVATLPTRYRRSWADFVIYCTVDVADKYDDELSNRGTALGDSKTEDKSAPRYRGIPVIEVPLLTGTQDGDDYSTFAVLCQPRNLKTGFHRKVRVEKYRDPREGLTSFLPSVRYDVAWAQDTATVLATNIPVL